MSLVRKYFITGLAVSLLLGLVFAFLGVYDTNSKPFFHRFVFWSATMVAGILTTGFVAPLTFNRLFPNQHRFIQLCIIAAIISFPVTLVLAGFDHNYGTDWSSFVWLLQYRYVVVISLILIFGGYFILKAQGRLDGVQSPHDSDKTKVDKEQIQAPANKEQKAEAQVVAAFMSRLSKNYHQAELYAVSSEDHYLRVHTSIGDELILMRLSDALRELEPVAGLQTHRSWWVAFNAVKVRRYKHGKSSLILKSNVTVPVSRTFDKSVKDAEFPLSS